MISTERFLSLLEEKDLLSPRTLASLREQVAQAKAPVDAVSIAKRLVKHGRLTPAQAKRLLTSDEGKGAASKPTAAKPAPEGEESELGFTPLEGEPDIPTAKPSAKKSRPKQAATKPDSKQPTKVPSRRVPESIGTNSLLDEEMPSQDASLEDAGMGPLDGLMSDAAMASAATGGVLTTASSKGKGKGFRWLFSRKPKKIQAESEQWGSPLMLLGGGALLLFVILLVALLYSLFKTSGDEMLEMATDDYRAGSYAQAIHKYENFLEKCPKHAGVSLARVRIGLAKMRQATQTSSDWPEALRTSNDVLAKIASEDEFKEAHGELAAMLPAIAEGLAADARKKTDPILVDQAREAAAMTVKYVPKSLRPVTKLTEIEGSLALTVREIARGNELDKTVDAMQEAANQLKTDEAYAACGLLLRQYPNLADDAKLEKALLSVSLAQQTLVKGVSEPKSAVSAEAETAVLSSVTLAHCNTKSKIPDLDGQIAFASVDGAVYGLEAATGRVLWRRFVGLDANPQAPPFPPTPLSPEPDSDALMVDTARSEILRLEGATGRVRWRYAVGEPFDAYPVIVGDEVLVATRAGKLVTINAASGNSSGYVQLPQPLCVAPAVDTRQSLVYQIADHTNLFVLSLADGVCKHVAYLGHERGSITTAPVLIGGYLLVAVNDGARDGSLLVFATRSNDPDNPETFLKLIQQIRLEGHIQTPPLAEGRRVLATTNRGVVRIFELSATDAKTPLRDVADTAIEGADNLIRFPLMQGGQFWIADTRLTKYDVQAARGRLMPQWIADEDSAFLQPPVAVGRAIVTVRRKWGRPGAIVSAVAMQEPDLFWETQLASPVVGEPRIPAGGGKLVAVASNGSVFQVDAGQTKTTIFNTPAASIDPFRFSWPVSHVLQLSDGLMAISGGKGSNLVGVFDPKSQSPMFSWVKIPDAIACGPVSFGRGLLAACKSGQVFLIDPKSGAPLAEPFQPKLEAGVDVHWITPTVFNDKQAILTDGKSNLFLLGVKDQPKPHLTTLAEAAVTEPIVSPLAVLGETVYGYDTAKVLTAFALPKLVRGKEHVLGGRHAWGPGRVGDHVLLSTDDGQLLCMNAKGEQLWQTALAHGPLAGTPLQLGEHYLLASQNGIVWRIEAATGKELGSVAVGCPLGAGPVLLGQRLLVSGHDGTLYEVRQP